MGTSSTDSSFDLFKLPEGHEEVARVDASASLIPAVNKLGTMGLILRGSDDLKKQVLPSLASGEAMAAYALSEDGRQWRGGHADPRQDPNRSGCGCGWSCSTPVNGSPPSSWPPPWSIASTTSAPSNAGTARITTARADYRSIFDLS